MINWNFDPVLFSLGSLEIRYYGLFYVIGFIMAFLYLNNARKKQKIELSKDQVYDLIFYLIIGVILGSRIFEVLFWNPGYYFSNPKEIIAVWDGGMSFHGGLIGAILAGYLFCRKNKFSLAKLADLIVISATLALSLGRIGNLLNSEIYGRVADVSWCFNFQDVIGCRHPYQIYMALMHFLSFLMLLNLNKKEHKNGSVFWTGVLFFGIGRFLLDFFREDILYYGLSLGQYFSIPLVLISIYYLKKKNL
ncbi:MAG: Prolipoprotein diacylglyceryl transferase [archaeon GW2011_AR20]|nr:MAG: Prolipoprotein diacylglyceryl transferase [archaeon GW2011_AR20]MBS3160958.1 prolipoprotein diacylglyceryl transferase [Candidatus Woesearchaeota archaeon]